MSYWWFPCVLLALLIGLIIGMSIGITQGKQDYAGMRCDQFTQWQYNQGVALSKCKR